MATWQEAGGCLQGYALPFSQAQQLPQEPKAVASLSSELCQSYLAALCKTAGGVLGAGTGQGLSEQCLLLTEPQHIILLRGVGIQAVEVTHCQCLSLG